jgi:hypothetical protein
MPKKKTGGKPVIKPEHASTLQSRTPEDIANEQTVEQLALRLWAAMVGETVLSGMSALMDELLTSSLLDDDDEEGDDEGWLDDHHEREKKILDEAITDGLDKFPDINAINNLPPSSDPKIAQDADQLRDVLAKCAIGATEFKKKFPRAQVERLVKFDLAKRLKEHPKYSEHVRGDVPGSNIKKYGSRGRTSSKGTFTRAHDFVAGGGLDALLTGGWRRVAKDRIEPVAWSHKHGHGPHTERQSWWQHFEIIDRKGSRSPFNLERAMLAGGGHPALKQLMQSGVHLIHRKGASEALVAFLRYKPKREIVRMPRVGWAQIGTHWVFVRSEEVIVPPSMSKAGNTTYELESTAISHGLHVAGTAEAWGAEIAAPLRGNSNVALSLGTFFGSPLLTFANEPGGGTHLHGKSTIGKTMVSALGQSIYGWPHETAADAFGTSWEGTVALMRLRSPAPMSGWPWTKSH